MASITSRVRSLPKLRVTRLSCNEEPPQYSQRGSTEIDRDDDESARKADFDDGFGRCAAERDAGDDTLGLAGLSVSLALNDFACEDDVFKVEDREIVIVKFLCCVG